MEPSQPVEPFDWRRIWLTEDLPVSFLGEIAFRTFFMYLLVLAVLRITGKRGVKQLSLFELTIILGLGSAAGDPMFYHDVPILHALMVFAVVAILYLLFNYLTEKSPRAERWLEGYPECIVEEGRIRLEALKGQNLTYQELFGEMRQQQIEHLGQVKRLYLEATGEISVFFFEDDEVKPGMPIWPEVHGKAFTRISRRGQYACATCGHSEEVAPIEEHACPVCQKTSWLNACLARRTT